MFCAWGLECSIVQEVKRIMEFCVKQEWRVGLNGLLALAEPGRGFVKTLGDRVALPDYPHNVHPFFLWKSMEGRNTRMRIAMEGWWTIRDYVIDWEKVLVSGLSREMMDRSQLKYKLANYWRVGHPRGRGRGWGAHGQGVGGGCRTRSSCKQSNVEVLPIDGDGERAWNFFCCLFCKNFVPFRIFLLWVCGSPGYIFCNTRTLVGRYGRVWTSFWYY